MVNEIDIYFDRKIQINTYLIYVAVFMLYLISMCVCMDACIVYLNCFYE